MSLDIMENVRRVAVSGLKTAKVILSRVAVLESETAELILVESEELFADI
jgi:hypothetical protein